MGFLDGKVAIITGAGHGLGRSHARTFAQEGVEGIVINDIGVGLEESSPRSAESAEETVRLLKELDCDAVAVFGDCADMAAGQEMVETALRRWGRLDIVVNNAGNLRDKMIFNMNEEDWDRVIRVHLKGHFATTRYATEHWRKQSKLGQPAPGRIINTSSAAGLFGNAGQPNYSAAKAGIVGLTLALASAMARYNVTANVVAPWAETAPEVQIEGIPQELRDAMPPEHVSPLIAFLASGAASHITGRIFHAAGGRIDHITQHELVKGVTKLGSPWTVGELAAAFQGMPGDNPRPVQEILREIGNDVVGAGGS